MDEIKEFYSVAEIARMEDKSKQAILQLIKNREVKKQMHANSFVIHKSELYKFG